MWSRSYHKDMLGAKSVIRQISEWSAAIVAPRSDTRMCSIIRWATPRCPHRRKIYRCLPGSAGACGPGYAARLHAHADPARRARQKVAESLNRRFGMDYTGDHIFMTTGAAGALAHAVRCIAVPGQNIVTFAPFFPEYKPYVEGAGLTLRVAPPRCEDFQVNFDVLDSLVAENTAAILINSPNNPSGTAYSAETLTKLAAYLKKKSAEYGHHIFLISDEPYREIAFGVQDRPVPR